MTRTFDEFYLPEPNSGCWLWLRFLEDEGIGWNAVQEVLRG
jgi:hypothetical protein